jgi:autotransporter-associated beta strand protein
LQAGTGGGTWAGPITLGLVSSRVGATPGNTLTITGSIASGTTTGLSISGGGGTGVVVLKPTTPNTYTGQTNLVRGTLRLGINDALPVTTVVEAKDLANSPDATGFDLAGFNQTIAGLLDSGTPVNTVITNSAAATTSTLTINSTAFYTYDGLIENGSGTVALTKEGSGTETLTGVNAYTGATTVNGGTLRVNGTGSLAAGSAVTVGASGTLGGTGTVNGTVNASGTIAPGSGGVGTLTVGATTLSGTLAVEIDGANGDKLVSTGAVVLSGPLTVNLLGGGFTQSSYVIAQGSGLTGSFSSVPSGYSVSYSGTQATLTQTAGADYNSWAASFGLQNPWLGINPALNGESTADPDGDGMSNQQEYAFGLVPTSGSSVNPITVQLDKTAGTFSYTRRATPLTTGLAYTVKTSPDLLLWTPDTTATASQAVTGTVGGVQTVQVTLSGAPLTATKLFVRMEAQ